MALNFITIWGLYANIAWNLKLFVERTTVEIKKQTKYNTTLEFENHYKNPKTMGVRGSTSDGLASSSNTMHHNRLNLIKFSFLEWYVLENGLGFC